MSCLDALLELPWIANPADDQGEEDVRPVLMSLLHLLTVMGSGVVVAFSLVVGLVRFCDSESMALWMWVFGRHLAGFDRRRMLTSDPWAVPLEKAWENLPPFSLLSLLLAVDLNGCFLYSVFNIVGE